MRIVQPIEPGLNDVLDRVGEACRVSQEFPHEERIARSSRMELGRVIRGYVLAGKLEGEVLLDVLATQEAQSDFLATLPSQEIGLDAQEWVICDLHFSRPIADDQHCSGRFEPRGQKCKEIY